MYENLLKLIQQAETADRIGKIENVVGMSMEASGGRSGIGDIVMLKYGGTSIGNESVTEPSRARADEKRRAEWLKPVRRHIIL